jgi:two-component system, response regulator YesN
MVTIEMVNRKIRKGRVFYTYLISYVPILLIPILMSVVLFNRAQSVLDSEAARANDLLLNQMNSYLDMVMTDARQLYFLVAYNPRLASMLHESTPVETDEYYRAYQIANDFNVYKIASESIVEFYVYLPRLDMIISPTGIYASRKYLSYRLPLVGRSYDEWTDQFSFVPRTIYVASETETAENEVVSTIAMITPLPVSGQTTTPKGWTVVHVDLKYFRDVFKNTSWSAESLLLVYHNDFGVITTSDPKDDITSAELMAAKQEFAGKHDGDVVRFRGEPYIVLSRESSVVNWRYISMVPADIYVDQFKGLTRLTFSTFIVVLIVGGLLIYWFAVVRYRPVHDLLSLVTPDSEGTISLRSDEFSLIANSLELTRVEDQRLRREVERSESILLHRYFKQLLQGEVSSDEGISEQLSRYGVVFREPFLVLVLIDVELDEDSDHSIRQVWQKALGEMTAGGDVYHIRDLNGKNGFLHNLATASLGGLVTTLEAKKREVESDYAAYWAIGVSSVRPVGDDFSALYGEAKEALEFRLVKGRSAPILFDEIQAGDNSYYYPMEVENKLINSIKTGDAEGALMILEEVYSENFGGKFLPLEIARCLMFDLISTMIKTINLIVVRDEDSVFWAKIKPITRLMACQSFEQLHIEMDDILARVCEYVNHGRAGRGDRLKSEILDFIEANYAEKNLSPDWIADRFSRNRAYLSRYFRERTGMGLSTYLKQVRVEKAKSVLTDGTVAVHDVADYVGFSSSNALIRAFKEIEGVTPGQYREALFA